MRYRRKGLAFLQNSIQERLDGKLDENGQKPHDLVQWLTYTALPIERTVPQAAEGVMALNCSTTGGSGKVGRLMPFFVRCC